MSRLRASFAAAQVDFSFASHVSGSTPPAVLLGGTANAVSAARSLSRLAGAAVYALGRATDPVRRSRHCAGFVDVGAGDDVQARCMTWLEQGPRGAVVLPCIDDGVELIGRNRRRLEQLGYHPIEADDEVLLAMLDKARTYTLARQAGLPTPRTATVRRPEEADSLSAEFEFPYALKPLHSHLFARHFRDKVLLVHNRAELLDALTRTDALGLSMLLTEIVPGDDDQYHSYYSYLDGSGQALVHFTKRKFRQWPIRFGLSCYQTSDWNEEAAEAGLRFFQGIGLRGVGNVEFKRDARDGQLKVIECNPRFTAANELVRLSGIDFPLIAYHRALGRESALPTTYRCGLRMWHPLEDARALVAYRRSGELTTRQWLRSLLHRLHFPMFRVDDPMPTVASLAAKTWRLGHRTRIRLRGVLGQPPSQRKR